jgi:hypothetical protein
VWNVYHRTKAGLPRTNNSVEGWNNRLKNKINKSHPSVGRIIKIFKEEQRWVEECFQMHQVGDNPPPQMMKYVDLNARLVALVKDFHNRETMDYIEGVAHNLLGIRKIKRGKKSRTDE